MKAIVKTKKGPGLEMIEVPMPQYKEDEVLIKIKKSAICGTDVSIYKWTPWAEKTIHVPQVIGHEFMGVVEAIGSNVKGVAIGDRVSGEGHITCGVCRNCKEGKRHLCPATKGVGVNRQGCFAEYLVSPKRMSSSSRTTSLTISAPSSTLSAMPPTPPSPSTWWGKMSSSPAPDRSAAWPEPSANTRGPQRHCHRPQLLPPQPGQETRRHPHHQHL